MSKEIIYGSVLMKGEHLTSSHPADVALPIDQ